MGSGFIIFMKIYILQKDLPDVKAGAEGVVNETGLLCYYEGATPEYFFPKETYENNPEWFKEKKEEKSRVHRMWPADNSNWDELRFSTTPPIIEVAIKNERLSEILIAESKGQLSITCEVPPIMNRIILAAEEKAFNAAREWKCRSGQYNLSDAVPSSELSYKTFTDYKNSIK